MKEKFIKKYMRLAKFIGTDQNPCFSRQIGAVIIDPIANKILGTGYNGPPPGTPHTDTRDYLAEYFWPQLTEDEKQSLRYTLLNTTELTDPKVNEDYVKLKFLDGYTGKKICPRRLINAKSGQRTDLCSCGHAERHAITNCSQTLTNMWMFCWCGIPCLQCTDSIIQSGISEVHCLVQQDYHPKSRWLFEKANIKTLEYTTGDILAN